MRRRRPKSSKELQAATEFLIQYSWEIIVLLVALSAIVLITVLQHQLSITPSYCYISPELNCYQTALAVNLTGSSITTFFTNSQDHPIILTGYFVAPSTTSGYYQGVCSVTLLQPGQSAQCTAYIPGLIPQTGSVLNPTFYVNYNLCNGACGSSTQVPVSTEGTAVVSAPASFSHPLTITTTVSTTTTIGISSSTTTVGASTTTIGASTTTVGASTTTIGVSSTTTVGISSSTTTVGVSSTTTVGLSSTTTVGLSTTTVGLSTTTVGLSTTTTITPVVANPPTIDNPVISVGGSATLTAHASGGDGVYQYTAWTAASSPSVGACTFFSSICTSSCGVTQAVPSLYTSSPGNYYFCYTVVDPDPSTATSGTVSLTVGVPPPTLSIANLTPVYGTSDPITATCYSSDSCSVVINGANYASGSGSASYTVCSSLTVAACLNSTTYTVKACDNSGGGCSSTQTLTVGKAKAPVTAWCQLTPRRQECDPSYPTGSNHPSFSIYGNITSIGNLASATPTFPYFPAGSTCTVSSQSCSAGFVPFTTGPQTYSGNIQFPGGIFGGALNITVTTSGNNNYNAGHANAQILWDCADWTPIPC